MADSNSYTIAVPLHTREERRRAERFSAAMPVSVDGHAGTTQDLSCSGLSFLSDQPFEIGARVEVVIEYLLDGHQYPLRCQAEVVRVTPAEGGYQVGARLSAESMPQDVPVGESTPAADDGAEGGARLRRVV